MRRNVRSEARRARARGFTLLEMLVAVALLAVVAVLSWRGLDQIARADRSLGTQMGDLRALAACLDQIGTDARLAASEPEALGRALDTRGGVLTIVRHVGAPSQRQLQVVRYRLHEGVLSRSASPSLHTVGELQQALSADTGTRIELVRGLASFQAQVWIDRVGLRALPPPPDPSAAALADVAPPARVVTGLQVQLRRAGQAHPYDRLVLVGR